MLAYILSTWFVGTYIRFYHTRNTNDFCIKLKIFVPLNERQFVFASLKLHLFIIDIIFSLTFFFCETNMFTFGIFLTLLTLLPPRLAHMKFRLK